MPKHPKFLPKDDNNEEEEWQELLSTIDATDIPIEMLKILKAHMNDGISYIFPILEWLEQGADPDDVKESIVEWYHIHDEEIIGSDFVVNLNKLASTVTAETKKTLKGL